MTPRNSFLRRRPSPIVWLTSSAVVAILAIYIYGAIIAPRPYYVAHLDLEHDHYYNARNILETGFPSSALHPGTPVYYLGAFNVLIAGTEFESTQLSLNIGHIEITLLTVVGIVGFAYLVLRAKPIWISILALATIIAWPTTFTSLDYFSGDGFLAAAALLLSSYFWHHAVRNNNLTRRVLIICGIGIGTGLAIKLTMLPITIAIILAVLWQIARRERRSSVIRARANRIAIYRGVREAAILTMTAIATFAILILPILRNLPSLVRDIWVRRNQGTLGPPDGGSLPERFVWIWQELPQISLMITAVAILLIVAVILKVKRRERFTYQKCGSAVGAVANIDHSTAIIFLSVLGASFFFALSNNVQSGFFRGAGFFSDVPRAEYGLGLRNVVPTNLFLPFVLVYLHALISTSDAPVRPRFASLFKASVIAGTVVVVAWASFDHFNRRDEFIDLWGQEIAPAITYFEETRAPGTRVALGLEYNGLEAGFHYYGNLAYGIELFDDEVTNAFPTYSPFWINEVPRFLNRAAIAVNVESTVTQVEDASEGSGLKARLKSARDWWERNVGIGPWSRSRKVEAIKRRDMVSFREEGRPLSIIAFPTAARTARRIDQQALLSLLCDEFGGSTLTTKTIGGREWEIVEISGKACSGP